MPPNIGDVGRTGLEKRAVAALESIAVSLEKIANPLVVVQNALVVPDPANDPLCTLRKETM
jgi:hypothetical protein